MTIQQNDGLFHTVVLPVRVKRVKTLNMTSCSEIEIDNTLEFLASQNITTNSIEKSTKRKTMQQRTSKFNHILSLTSGVQDAANLRLRLRSQSNAAARPQRHRDTNPHRNSFAASAVSFNGFAL
jgi:hypothetical protein